MGILRSDVVSHSQLEPTGSVLLDGNSDYLSWSSHDSLKMGTSDFTLEAWVNITGNSDANLHQTIFMAGDSSDAGEMVFQMIRDTGGGGSALGSGADRELGVRVAGTGYYSGIQLTFGQWHHVVCVRDGGTITFFVDGVKGKSSVVTENLTTAFTQIGYRDSSYDGYLEGYVSNARIAFGAHYKNDFTPSKFELKNVPGTVLLCCQSSTSATTAAVKPGTITANGTAAASAVIPDLKKDITDVGVVFEDNTKFDTLSYMVPPGGTTTQSNRGRGVIGGGFTPTLVKTVQYIEIQSSGTSVDFGDKTDTRYAATAVSSSTRGVMAGGHSSSSSPYPVVNTMDYITIATTSNAIDFGDLVVAAANRTGTCNNTRGVIIGGYNPNTRAMDYITIATTSNAIDFGDSIAGYYGMNKGGVVNSPTRGVVAGGNSDSAPTAVNTIQYITIATTGDSTDFGDMSHDNGYFNAGACSETRGLFASGADITSPYATTNAIDYITIATTGNGTDFGDLTVSRYTGEGVSNGTRGVFAGGATPTNVNTMDYVTIASTGNAKDFGDLFELQRQGGGMSDSHGGIS